MSSPSILQRPYEGRRRRWRGGLGRVEIRNNSLVDGAQMITRNFEDYPEHRLQFFALLRAITNHCFRALFALSPQNLKLVIDSVIWAFRHTERNVAEMGLNLLLEMLQVTSPQINVTSFYGSSCANNGKDALNTLETHRTPRPNNIP
eukprot:104585-Prorocentrum_minimum.AAC.1